MQLTITLKIKNNKKNKNYGNTEFIFKRQKDCYKFEKLRLWINRKHKKLLSIYF